jgi:hypothetical protein
MIQNDGNKNIMKRDKYRVVFKYLPPSPGDNQMLSSIRETIIEVFMEFHGDSQNERNNGQQWPEILHV